MSLVANSSAVHSSETARVKREEGVDDVKSRIICPLQVVQEQLFESETIIKIVSK